jgi:choline dehydrogenase
MALRGVPADYDEWADWGNNAWSWPQVLPYFRRLEDDADERGDFHGSGGPIPIRRAKLENFVPPQRAFFDICRDLGFLEMRDLNAPGASGIGPWPSNARDGIRISTALGYLLPARHRLNLTVRSGCLIHRVLFTRGHAAGVEVECGGKVQKVHGRRIILAAGAFASPAILLRSGIGPADRVARPGSAPASKSPLTVRTNST